MDIVINQLEKVADLIAGEGYEDLANQLIDNENQFKEILEENGDPDMVVGMINDIWVQFSMEENNKEGLIEEIIENLQSFTHPSDVIYQLVGSKLGEDDNSRYRELAYYNQEMYKMYNAEKEQYDKQEMLDEGLLKCPRCNINAVVVNTKQTRSGDEAETKFFRCNICQYAWRQG